MAGSADLPDKLYFKIGEVARIVGVKPHVLRYWETEFEILRPGKSRSRHRLYRRRDVETLLEIKRLLHEERFTIEGARRHLRQRGASQQQGEARYRRLLSEVRDELRSLLALLERPPD